MASGNSAIIGESASEARAVDAGRAGQRYFESLDLIRGLAALLVLVYHADFMFGLRHRLLPGGYLAVDLFFVLSGFVLSLNYGRLIASGALSLSDYAIARVARLYPLFVATTVAGLMVMTARYRSNYGYYDATRLAESAIANVVLVPSFAMPYGLDYLFPFNAASWSIFFEFVASFLFFAWLGRMSRRALVAIAIVAGIALIATIWRVGTVDQGYSTTTFLPGFPRVVFSFGVGVIVERAYRRRPWRVSRPVFFVLLAFVIGLMQFRLFIEDICLYDVAAVVFVAPALIVAGVGVSLDGSLRRVATFLGEISYSVYLTQGALIIAAAGLAQAVAGRKIYDLGAWVGFVFVPVVVAVSYVSHRVFEKPARKLVRRLASRQRGDYGLFRRASP